MTTGDTRQAQSELPDAVVDDILDSQQRRLALEVLAKRDEPLVIDDLAAAVWAHEHDCDTAAVSREQRRAIRDEFFARHLPKLTATGVVDYDSMVGTLSLTADERITDRLL